MRNKLFFTLLLTLVGMLSGIQQSSAATVSLALPLNRVAYQTNERIDLAVVRSDAQALVAGNMLLDVIGEDGSKLSFSFPADAAPLTGAEARTTEHLHLNGWLLRPGNYTLSVTVDDATAEKKIELYSHVRKSTFKLVDWIGTPAGPGQAVMGEDSLGFNVLIDPGKGDNSIRAGVDYMMGDTMGGGHQMDLRLECDWSDPYVLGGGRARVVRQALKDRTNGNCIGVHFYDEPGLTWQPHPTTGEFVPYNIPAQDRSYKSAFGVDAPQYNETKPGTENAVRWMDMGRWKESFMEAAWRYAAGGVHAVRPDFIATTQGMYGWNSFTDGYYFNIARAEDITAGHGWYEDITWGYHAPPLAVKMGRIRDLQKPVWYMPTWWATPPDRFRMNQYLSFILNIQGMMKPMPMTTYRPSIARKEAGGTDQNAGVVESNKAMARLGTIFTTMPVTHPQVALLYSLSSALNAEIIDMKQYYEGGGHLINVQGFLVASDLNGIPMIPVVEEDVLDGSVAAAYKAVVLPKVDYLDPKVISSLETFIVNGGLVLLSDDSQVQIKGGVKLGATLDSSMMKQSSELWAAKKMDELYQLDRVPNYEKIVQPLAKALATKLAPLGITSLFTCDNAGIIQGRQAFGDIEYLFAVNASYDAEVAAKNSIRPATASISLPNDGRPVYDAMLGGEETAFKVQGKMLNGQFRFGAGQMRVFARTSRPIGGVQVAPPTLFRDYTVNKAPLHLQVVATFVDDKQALLSGSVPMKIKLIDPFGATRYDLYRATDHGILQERLPLAVNDPAGKWTVEVTELLSNKTSTVSLTFSPPAQCGAVAGASQRAVYFGNDWDHIFNFFRAHQDVTIVKGTSEYNTTAAERLLSVLKPWGIRCTIVDASEVNKPRLLSDDEKRTWRGLQGGAGDSPLNVGFAIQGSAILLGTPKDNPLIMFLQQQEFLPYTATADFPGNGRGYLAWQLDGVGYGQESITAIASDADGMAEAIGTLYEMAAGLAPLTPLVQPSIANLVTPAQAQKPVRTLAISWEMRLADRAAGVKALTSGQFVVLSEDGMLSLIDAKGKALWQKTLSQGGERWALDVSNDGNVIAVGASQYLLAFDGKGKQLFASPIIAAFKPLPAVTTVAVSNDGAFIAAAGTNGGLTLFNKEGKRLWSSDGVDTATLATYATPKVTPVPYFGLAFSADGTSLVASTENQAQVISAKNRTVNTQINGINGRFPMVISAGNLLASDGKSTIKLCTLADGKVVKQMTMPGDGVVGLLMQGDQVIAGLENNSTLRQVKSLDGKVEEQTVWAQTTPCRIIKKMLAGADFTVVIYWGGLLQVIDPAGEVIASRTFSQDIADASLFGNNLITCLADSRVFALAVK